MDEPVMYPPVIELFRTEARRGLVRLALDTDDDEWYTKRDLADAVGTSRESIRKQFTHDGDFTLVDMGIYEVRDPDANIPHYRPADTSIMQLLREYEHSGGYPLDELFAYAATQDLVLFFLEDAAPDASYSKNQIQDEKGLHYNSVTNHIDTLIDADIVDAVDGARGTEFTRKESSTVAFLFELNQHLVEYIESQ
jgi:hypothetical protein